MSLALGAWLALLLALGRAGVIVGLELAHHGDARLAGLRLATTSRAFVLVAAGIAVAGILARVRSQARFFPRPPGGSAVPDASTAVERNVPDSVPAARVLGALALAAAALLFLAGHLDADRSRRIGLDTALGWSAHAVVASVAVLLACGFTFLGPRSAALRLLGSWRVLGAVLLGLGALGWSLRGTFGGLGPTMPVRQVEQELVEGVWETLRAHPAAPPRPGLLCPSAEYDADGAARLALLLPPPARVRRTLPDFEGERWLACGAGLDHSVGGELARRLPGHSVRFRLSVDGQVASAATLRLDGRHVWHELGGGEGIRVRGGARLELETELIDERGNEVVTGEPLLAGVGGLLLERRERLPRTPSSPERANLVLVVLDTLRADRTSAYGYARPTTPNLEALAARGVLFEELSATASWTWPSTASILTGLHPEQHGVEDAASSFLAQHLDTLPEALQRAGLTTAAWSGSPLIVPDKGFAQGFEHFDASREGRLRRSDLVLPGALEWLGTVAGTRFFLYLHLMEPHAPFVPLREARKRFAAEVPADYDTRRVLDHNWELQSAGFGPAGERRTEAIVPPEEQRWISDLYDGCVWSADHYLGQVLARLDELGLAAETIVAVTSDHGEELFEHGLLSHGTTLYRELVRVPLVIAGPGLPRGRRIAEPRSGVALGPTLARLAGAAIGGLGEPLDLFAGEGETIHFSTRQGWWNGYARQPLYGLRRGSMVLHYAPEAAAWGAAQPGPGELRLYDLARDPAEATDLAPLEPARAQSLRDELLRRLEGLEARRGGTGAEADPATIERLRGLGYVGD